MNPFPHNGKIHAWLSEPISNDIVQSINRLAQIDDVRRIAVLPDVHLAGEVCIGTVVATSNLILPAAIGGDIGCGMAAIRFHAGADLLESEQAAAEVLAGLYFRIPTNRHSTATIPTEFPEILHAISLSNRRLEKLKRRDGRVQLGTLGRGNHFLEFQADQQDQLWLMIHSGSRAMGQGITAQHVANTEAGANLPLQLEADSAMGQDYLNDVAWAIRYAEHNRLTMVSAAAKLLQDKFGVTADWSSLIDSHHNHVQQEEHFGERLWVHRKGAQSSQESELGIIPGSMATASFHVSGRGCQDSLCSSSHGAGRKLSRTQARQTITTRQLARQLHSVWFDQRRTSALRDEAPAAYKDIYSVLRAQKDLTRIVRELRPLLSYKGK